MDHNKIAIQNNSKKKYRLVNRCLPLSGELEWPLFLAIVRKVVPRQKTVQELTQDALLERYAPAGVLVDPLGNIVYVRGELGLFLEPAQNYYRVKNILKMVSKKIRRDLNATLYKAVTSRSKTDSPVITVKRDGETFSIIIRIIPLLKQTSTRQNQDFYLIIFEEQVESVLSQTSVGSIVATLDNQELNRINSEIQIKKGELSNLKFELESTQSELEISRNKLHSVKANIYESETKFQMIQKDLQENSDELEILSKKLLALKNEFETNSIIPLNLTPDQLPIREELETIKNDLFIASQALEEKKEMLEKLDERDEITADTVSIYDLNKSVAVDTENYLIDEHTFVTNEATMDEPEIKNYRLEPDPVGVNTAPFRINEEMTGFMSQNNFEPDLSMSTKKELNFNDAIDFQAAANHGFRHDNEITAVNIPEGVEVIKRSMFYKCTQLESVTFPSTLKAIEDFAFYGCEVLKEAPLNRCNALKVIGTSAFEGCKSISELVIPDSVIEIEEAGFLGCQNIRTVEFLGSSQLENLGSHVFKDCIQIKSLKLPDHLKHIGISCFYGCQNLTEVYLPKELETVGEYAFFGCNALEKIEIINKKILKQPGFSAGFPEGIKL